MRALTARRQRRADEAEPQPQCHRQRRQPQKRPPQARIELGDHAIKLLFAGAVEEPRRRKAQHDAACHAGVHHLNAQNGGLARARKAGHPVRLGKQSQRFQRGVVGCEEHQVGHQRQQGGILLFGFGAHSSHPHAENDAEVVDEHHHPVVKQLRLSAAAEPTAAPAAPDTRACWRAALPAPAAGPPPKDKTAATAATVKSVPAAAEISASVSPPFPGSLPVSPSLTMAELYAPAQKMSIPPD